MLAAKQAGDARILVHVRPVDPDAIAEDLDVAALVRAGTKQPGRPCEGRGDPAVVRDADNQLVVRDGDERRG